MSYPYRCTIKRTCGKRVSLKQHLHLYTIEPKCPVCKGKLSFDKNHTKYKQITCNCGDPGFPHRLRGSVWCKYHKTGPTEQDYTQRYGYIKPDPKTQSYDDWDCYENWKNGHTS